MGQGATGVSSLSENPLTGAILSLDYHKNRITWVVSGYSDKRLKKEKWKKGTGDQITSDAESVGRHRQVLPRHDPTHDEPGFSRFDMGADNSLAGIVNDSDKWITVKPRGQETRVSLF